MSEWCNRSNAQILQAWLICHHSPLSRQANICGISAVKDIYWNNLTNEQSLTAAMCSLKEFLSTEHIATSHHENYIVLIGVQTIGGFIKVSRG